MKKMCFSVAGIRCAFHARELAAEYLLDKMASLLTGFLISPDSKADADCLLFVAQQNFFPEHFGNNLRFVSGEESPTAADILADMKKHTLSQSIRNDRLVGFLNGGMTFDYENNCGYFCFFRSAGPNYFSATLYKHIFIYLALVMANNERIMVHGAGIRTMPDRKGYIFLGGSGAGKSTVAALSRGDEVLSDDAVVISHDGRRYLMHGSPFRQLDIDRSRGRRFYLRKVGLESICFLHQAAAPAMQTRRRASAFAELLTRHSHCFEIMDGPVKRKAFATAMGLCAAIPAYDLFFCRDRSFRKLIRSKNKPEKS
jgi:hypothetical protein